MSYKKITVPDLPKRNRIAVSKFEKTEEWRELSADIEKGFKANEALQLVMTDADKKRHNIKNRRTVARFIAKYLKDKKLPLILKSFHRDDMGDVFIVRHSPRR